MTKITPSPARCLSTLDDLPAEGLTPAAQRRLAGGNRQFPHQMDKKREELIFYRTTVVERLSISGIQEKVSLRLQRGKLELTDREGEYILKPVPGQRLPRFPEEGPANEHLTMLLAGRIFAIEIPPNSLVRLVGGELAYLVKRFDRREGTKVPQEDFCQILGRTPDTHGRTYKYDSSYEEIGAALKRHSAAYRIEIERLFNRILFCYAFSNGDAHLKNFSLFQTPNTGDYILTPAYDLACTSLHLPDESRLALPLFADDTETPGFLENGFPTGGCFLELARRFGIDPKRARKILSPYQEGPRIDVEALIHRSFLTPAAQQDYVARYRDRSRALRISGRVHSAGSARASGRRGGTARNPRRRGG